MLLKRSVRGSFEQIIYSMVAGWCGLCHQCAGKQAIINLSLAGGPPSLPRPADHYSLVHGELASIEGTSTRPISIDLVNASAAEDVPARQEQLDIVAIFRTTPASHLRLPLLVLHASDFHVEDRELVTGRCL